MSIDTTLVKRGALYKGEVGFFPTNEVAADDISAAKMNSEVVCTFYSPRTLEALKFLWALVHKVSENTDRYLDKDEAMSDLKLRAGYSKIAYDPKTKEMELRPKSLKRINDERLRQLTDKIIDIVCDEIIPGMKRNELRKEIEKMLEKTHA